LIFLGEHGNIVLEWVRDPEALAADVGNPLVSVPIRVIWESLVDTVIEVLVMGEDNMASDIVELREC
jgi:hypothetical protein